MAPVPTSALCQWDSQDGGVPADVLAGRQSTSREHRWYAIQTRSRHEKVVATRLGNHGIHTYLPTVAEVHRWSDRRRLVHVPLFPGYAFIRSGDPAETIAIVMRTEGVLGVLGAGLYGTPIPDEEIKAITRVLAERIPYANHPFLNIGQRVRVRGGPLDGVEGILLARKREAALVISIEMIRRSLAVCIEGYDVQAA